MVNQIRWFIGLDPSDTVQKCAEHDIVVEAYSPFAHGSMHPLPAAKGCRRAAQGDQTPHIQQNAELDFEISATDMSVLDAMRDTEKHGDAREFRWK
jgi:hypothetical protein